MTTKTSKRAPKIIPIDELPCALHVQRGGVQVSVEHIPLGQAVSVAAYLLRAFEKEKGAHPEFDRPQEVVQIGGYHPVDVTDDETWARKRRLGF